MAAKAGKGDVTLTISLSKHHSGKPRTKVPFSQIEFSVDVTGLNGSEVCLSKCTGNESPASSHTQTRGVGSTSKSLQTLSDHKCVWFTCSFFSIWKIFWIRNKMIKHNLKIIYFSKLSRRPYIAGDGDKNKWICWWVPCRRSSFSSFVSLCNVFTFDRSS